MSPTLPQNKASEIAFFDSHGAADAYDVFAPTSNERLIDAVVRLSGLPKGARVVDLGCGSGVFTDVLQRRGYRCAGVDLSPKLIEIARGKYKDIEFSVGDIERLSFPGGSFDGVLLSGVLHHLPDPSRCAAEVFRILHPGGKFVAFDPNRRNPFMYLYRDRSSPVYSSVGVTENERPVLAEEIAATFRKAGFRAGSESFPACGIATSPPAWRARCCRFIIPSTAFSLRRISCASSGPSFSVSERSHDPDPAPNFGRLMPADLDIVIPVYNEGRNILATLAALTRDVKTPSRVLICYDRPDDDTLSAIRAHPETHAGLAVEFVPNPGRGAHSAVLAGFAASTAPFVVVFPADDDFNGGILDSVVSLARQGNDIVCASRFMPGGRMEGCPWLKAALVRSAAFLLHRVARLPTHDPTSGFRLFSRRVIEGITVEIERRLLLQHRTPGEGAPAALARGGNSGRLVRAQAW